MSENQGSSGTRPRTAEELQRLALAVIDVSFDVGAKGMLCLFSGGHDSLSACHVASKHPRFPGEVHHIDTTIGAKATRKFVGEVCDEFGWRLRVHRSNFSYERFVRRLGFPGPGSHQWVYNHLKERCVSKLLARRKMSLITGCRSQESVRRMGHVEPIKVGETSKKTGDVSRKNRVWVAPCHDWSKAEQDLYMEHHGLPKNPLKLRLGMSGECFCGAFASPGELERIRCHAPDVAREIDRLAAIARECVPHSEWGTRPDKRRGLVVVESGQLCSSCDYRAAAAGIVFKGK